MHRKLGKKIRITGLPSTRGKLHRKKDNEQPVQVQKERLPGFRVRKGNSAEKKTMNSPSKSKKKDDKPRTKWCDFRRTKISCLCTGRDAGRRDTENIACRGRKLWVECKFGHPQQPERGRLCHPSKRSHLSGYVVCLGRRRRRRRPSVVRQFTIECTPVGRWSTQGELGSRFTPV